MEVRKYVKVLGKLVPSDKKQYAALGAGVGGTALAGAVDPTLWYGVIGLAAALLGVRQYNGEKSELVKKIKKEPDMYFFGVFLGLAALYAAEALGILTILLP